MEELLTASDIVVVVAKHHNTRPNDIFRHLPSGSRVVEDQAHLAALRISILLIHRHTQFSLPEIGKLLHRNHTTIYYHRKVITDSEMYLAEQLQEVHHWPTVTTLAPSSPDVAQQRLTHSFAERLIPKRSPSVVLLSSLRKELETRFERVDPLLELPDNTPDDT